MFEVTVFVCISALTLFVSGNPLDDAANDVANNSSADSTLTGEMVGGNFQGDMILSAEQLRNLNFGPRNGMVNRRARWPKNKRRKVVIPYAYRNPGEFSKSKIV